VRPQSVQEELTLKILILILLAAVAVQAAIVTPDSFGGPYCSSPAFGAASCSITDQYKDGGILFSQNGVGTAVFSDPPTRGAESA
jgi:hypothetical protein